MKDTPEDLQQLVEECAELLQAKFQCERTTADEGFYVITCLMALVVVKPGHTRPEIQRAYIGELLDVINESSAVRERRALN